MLSCYFLTGQISNKSNGGVMGKPGMVQYLLNGTKSDRSEPVRIQSSLELLSYVADAQSPQPISKSGGQEGD